MRVGMIGYGRVGQGVVTLLGQHADRYARRASAAIELTTILVRDTLRGREVPVPEGVHYTDEEREFLEREHDLVIECSSGVRASELVGRCLDRGVDVISSNEALIAAHGDELYARAEKGRARLAIEGAIAGGLPVVAALEHGMGAAVVDECAGLLSATCNDILTRMERAEEGYSEALAHARRAGMTQGDGSADVAGRVAAEKLAIIASLMYQRRVDVDRIRTTGIEGLTTEDQRLARELGHTVRLVARAQKTDAGIYLRVAPMLVDLSEPIAGVYGPRNAVFFLGRHLGRIMLTGEGAGALPTASAVLSDTLRLASQRPHKGDGPLNAWPVGQPLLEIAPAGETAKRFYVRVPVREHDGTVRALSEHLRGRGIVVRTLHELPGMLVFLTEPTARLHLDRALDEASVSGVEMGERVTLRVFTPQWSL